MATKKKAAKPAVKKSASSVKKAAPAKKVAKKASKPAPAKVAKKPAVSKKAVAKPNKPAPKSTPKKTAKQATPAKKKASTVKKNIPKPAAKVTATKSTAVSKAAQKSSVKKEMSKKTPQKSAAPKKAASNTTQKVASRNAKATPVKPSEASLNPKDIKVAPAKPVVLPPINTKTSRRYEPDFTKSVLDKPVNDPGAPIVRYSDVELNEFKEIILRKLDAAKKELAYLQGLITRKDEMGGDEGDNRYMTMEDGSLSMEREQLSQMASRQITFIDHLEKALMRIENKTYGICRVTGKLIDKARLRAVPHATLSIEAKMGSNK